MKGKFNLKEHEEKLTVIDERRRKGEITKDQLSEETDKALGVYCGVFAKLEDYVMGKSE